MFAASPSPESAQRAAAAGVDAIEVGAAVIPAGSGQMVARKRGPRSSASSDGLELGKASARLAAPEVGVRRSRSNLLVVGTSGRAAVEAKERGEIERVATNEWEVQ